MSATATSHTLTTAESALLNLISRLASRDKHPALTLPYVITQTHQVWYGYVDVSFPEKGEALDSAVDHLLQGGYLQRNEPMDPFNHDHTYAITPLGKAHVESEMRRILDLALIDWIRSPRLKTLRHHLYSEAYQALGLDPASSLDYGWYNLLTAPQAHFLKAELEDAIASTPAPHQLLDFGCGTGGVSLALADVFQHSEVARDATFLGWDPSEHAISHAKTVSTDRANVTFEQKDHESLREKSTLKGLSAVFLIDSLYFITLPEDKILLLTSLFALLAPRGKLILIQGARPITPVEEGTEDLKVDHPKSGLKEVIVAFEEHHKSSKVEVTSFPYWTFWESAQRAYESAKSAHPDEHNVATARYEHEMKEALSNRNTASVATAGCINRTGRWGVVIQKTEDLSFDL